jgi:proline iminopeptidase
VASEATVVQLTARNSIERQSGSADGIMAAVFPAITPYECGMLDVGQGHSLYWEACGNPRGRPALVLHGGPGSGCTEGARRMFDPQAYRIVLLDQRGCGRSSPRVSVMDPVSENTTTHLVGDIERLSDELDVDRWVVFGNSWGVTLGLVFAERHPQRIAAMVLASVTLTRPADIEWLYHGAGRYLPDAWHRFRDAAPAADRDGDLVETYYRLLHEQPEPGVREAAAAAWCAWEDALAPLPTGQPNPRYDASAFRMTFARIVTHYFRHHAWLSGNEILENAHQLKGIPGVLIHGTSDLGGPASVAEELAEAWPDAELRLVDEGHAGGGRMTDAVLDATSRFSA